MNWHPTDVSLPGSDGLRLWDLAAMKKLEVRWTEPEGDSQITAVVWMTAGDAVWESICVGTSSGKIMMLMSNRSGVSCSSYLTQRSQLILLQAFHRQASVHAPAHVEVTALAWIQTPQQVGWGYLASATRDGTITLWEVDIVNGSFKRSWSIQLPEQSIPRSLAYMGDTADTIIVFSVNGCL